MRENGMIGDTTVILKFGEVVYEMSVKKFWDSMTPWIVQKGDQEFIDFTFIPEDNILNDMQIYGADGFTNLKKLTRFEHSDKFSILETFNGNTVLLDSANKIKLADVEELVDVSALELETHRIGEKLPVYSNFSPLLDIDANIAYTLGYVSNAFNDDKVVLDTKIEFTTEAENGSTQMRNTEFKQRVLDAFKHQGIKKNPTNICVPISKLNKIFKLLSIDEDVVKSKSAAEAPPTILSWWVPSKIAYLCGVFDACAISYVGNSIMVVAPSYKMQNQLFELMRSVGVACKKQTTMVDDEINSATFSILVRLDWELEMWSSNLFKKIWDMSYIIRTMRENANKEAALDENAVKLCKTIGQFEEGGRLVKSLAIEDEDDDGNLNVLCYADDGVYGVETESGEFYAHGLILSN